MKTKPDENTTATQLERLIGLCFGFSIFRRNYLPKRLWANLMSFSLNLCQTTAVHTENSIGLIIQLIRPTASQNIINSQWMHVHCSTFQWTHTYPALTLWLSFRSKATVIYFAQWNVSSWPLSPRNLVTKFFTSSQSTLTSQSLASLLLLRVLFYQLLTFIFSSFDSTFVLLVSISLQTDISDNNWIWSHFPVMLLCQNPQETLRCRLACIWATKPRLLVSFIVYVNTTLLLRQNSQTLSRIKTWQ